MKSYAHSFFRLVIFLLGCQSPGNIGKGHPGAVLVLDFYHLMKNFA